MTAVNGSFSRTVADMLRASPLSPQRQSDLYQSFLENEQVVPADFRDDWNLLVRTCDGSDRAAALAVPVAWNEVESTPEAQAITGAEQSFAHYLGQREQVGGVEAVWAGAVLAAGKTNGRSEWLDRGVADCAGRILNAGISASDEMMRELAGKITGVLSREFDALAGLLRAIEALEGDLGIASLGNVKVTGQAMKSFEAKAGQIRNEDERIMELLLETELVERYEKLVHPDARNEMAGMLRGKLWAGAPRIDSENEAPIAALFEMCVDIVSSKAGEVLGTARDIGITPR